jgi:uncharacterized SAM-binding protein YcdF (DUF218 family)
MPCRPSPLMTQFRAAEVFSPFRIVRRLIALIVIFVVALPIYVAGQIWWTGTHSSTAKADAIVVLGAAQLNGRPGPILTARLQQALAIYPEQAPFIVTTGGNAPGDLTTEAEVGRRWLHLRGISYTDLKAVAVGRDTYASTKAYTDFVKSKEWTSVVVVTDPWHCFRARAMARHFGVSAVCSPSTTGPAQKATWRYFQREILGYLAFTFLSDARLARGLDG